MDKAFGKLVSYSSEQLTYSLFCIAKILAPLSYGDWRLMDDLIMFYAPPSDSTDFSNCKLLTNGIWEQRLLIILACWGISRIAGLRPFYDLSGNCLFWPVSLILGARFQRAKVITWLCELGCDEKKKRRWQNDNASVQNRRNAWP